MQTTAGYRAFRMAADQILIRGMKNLDSTDVDRLLRALGPEAPPGAKTALDQLRASLGGATGEERLRRFTTAIAGVRQAFLLACRVDVAQARRLTRTPLSEQILVELEEGDLSENLSPQVFASSKFGRYKATSLMMKSPIFTSLSREKLIPVLTNQDLAPGILSLLKRMKPDKKISLAKDLLGRTNLLLRRAGLALVKDLPIEERAPLLVGALKDRDLRQRVVQELLEDPPPVFPHLISALMSEDFPDKPMIFNVLRRMRLSKSKDPVSTFLEYPDPEIQFWSRLTMHASGAQYVNYLREIAAGTDQALWRIYAKLELINDGLLRERYLVAELKSGDQLAHVYAAQAIAELPNFPSQLQQIVTALSQSGDREMRLKAIQTLALFNDIRLLEAFEEAARDPHPPVWKRAIGRLVALKGFQALQEHFDLHPMLNTPYEQLTISEQQYILYHLVPLIPLVPDFRFAPYLGGLTADTCEKGIDLHFELNLRPILVEFGEPLLYELGSLALSENPHLSSVGEELLLRLRLSRARELVERSRSAAAPVQVAFRNLFNKSLKEQARRELAAAGKMAVESLVPGLNDPRIREDVLWILGRIRDPSTIPRLMSLLGDKLGDEGGSSTIALPAFLENSLTQCLISFGEPGFKPMRKALTNEAWDVRCHAAHILGRARDHDSVGEIRGMLKDDVQEVVIVAAGALGNLMDEDSIPPLAALLEHTHPLILRAAVQALVQINSREAIPYLDRAITKKHSLNARRDLQWGKQKLEESGTEVAHNPKSGFLTEGIKSLFGARR